DTFKKASDYGLKYVEFTMNDGADITDYENRLAQMKEESDKYGVKVASIGRWGALKNDDDGNVFEEELNSDYRLIESCKTLNCPVYVTGFNFANNLSNYENYTNAIKYFEKLIAKGKECGVKIATYNCEWNSFVVRDEQWKIIHNHLKDLGIKFDSANCVYNGCDYLAQTRDWGDRFYHVHIKGHLLIDGVRFDDPPAGLDQTDWKSFFAMLYAKKYDGVVSIEPHSENWNGELGEKGIKYTIE
ncbi:MAG: sugar phosphate isomerase/epimerase family protein, partial [Oscillospiraceae bacterium]